MAELTPWFPYRIKPVRVGVYKVQCNQIYDDAWSYWDGQQWSSQQETPSAAFAYRHHHAYYQHKRWCGLASKL